MEPNRQWNPAWDGLDVRVQRTWTLRRTWRQRGAFSDENYVHLPWDTIGQLRRLRPDALLSFEMGARTLMAIAYARWWRRVPVVLVANMSERTELSRGRLRPRVRRHIARRIDLATYNGPSCRRYLLELGIPAERLYPLPYCASERFVYRGPLRTTDEMPRRIVFAGALSERKGIVPLVEALARWCTAHPQREIELRIAGQGPLADAVSSVARPRNLNVTLLSHCDGPALVAEYGAADFAAYPSLADEWGLGIEEALKSGLPVLASRYAQATEALCREGVNAWILSPDDRNDLDGAVERALGTPPARLAAMRKEARRSTEHITSQAVADAFVDVVGAALQTGRQCAEQSAADSAWPQGQASTASRVSEVGS